jgi:hypothetical protein
MNSKLAYIIPAHKVDHRLLYAVESALAQSEKTYVVVACTPEVAERGLPDKYNNAVNLVIVDGDDTSMQNLVNAGLEIVKSLDDVEWFSILEFDDKVLPNATKLFMRYREVFPEFNAFAGLGLVCESNGERNPQEELQAPNLRTMANEAAWAANIMEQSGVFDFNAMLRMNFILLTCCFFKLEILEEIGQLKPNMKYFYDYEFLLRVVYNGHNIRAIPKATHYHFTNGEGISAHHSLNKTDADFWSNTARKEYFFEFDRKLVYEPTTEETETRST